MQHPLRFPEGAPGGAAGAGRGMAAPFPREKGFISINRYDLMSPFTGDHTNR